MPPNDISMTSLLDLHRLKKHLVHFRIGVALGQSTTRKFMGNRPANRLDGLVSARTLP